MIDISSIDQTPIIEITFSDKMTKEDIDKTISVFEEKTKEQEPVNILLHAENVKGVTLDGLWEDTKMIKFLKSIHKAAIVSNQAWLKADAKLENLIPGVEVAYFTPDKQEEAIAWLKR